MSRTRAGFERNPGRYPFPLFARMILAIFIHVPEMAMMRFLVRLLLVLLVVAACILTWIYGINREPAKRPALFEAAARFQVRMIESGEPGARHLAQMNQMMRRIRPYNLHGPVAVEQALRDTMLDTWPRDEKGEVTQEGRPIMEARIESVIANVTIDSIGDSGIELITVKVRDAKADHAVALANRLMENYITNVRREMDDTLLLEHRFHEAEMTRYHRRCRELEGALLRFRLVNKVEGVDIGDPIAVFSALDDAPLRKNLDDARRRLDRLRELTKGITPGDQLILEQLRLEEAVESAEAALKLHAENKEHIAVINRNFFQLRNEHDKIVNELAAARENHAFWKEKLHITDQAMTFANGLFGPRLAIIQRAVAAMEAE